MKSILTKTAHFVLYDGENSVIAIIKADKGETDLEPKLITAISEHFDAESVVINDSRTLSYGDDISFDCDIAMPEEEDYDGYTFHLTCAEIY